MTAIVERSVSWYLPSFDGSFIADGRITFTPSGFDTDAVADAGLIPSPTDVALGASGEGTIDLWPNVAGIRATHYAVAVRGRSVSDQRMRTFSLGKFQVMNIVGPQKLSDLLNVGVPAAQQVVASFFTLANFEALVTEAEDAATAAAASEVSAEADAVATAADRVQTGLDRTAITSGSIWLIQNLTEKVVLGLGTLLVISEQDFDLVVGATTYVIPTVTLEFPT